MQCQSDRINLGLVLRLPRERLDDVLEEIARLPDVFVVHRQPSWLKLYVTERPPDFKKKTGLQDTLEKSLELIEKETQK